MALNNIQMAGRVYGIRRPVTILLLSLLLLELELELQVVGGAVVPLQLLPRVAADGPDGGRLVAHPARRHSRPLELQVVGAHKLAYDTQLSAR